MSLRAERNLGSFIFMEEIDMVQHHESLFYNTLDELQATHKSDHPDILNLKKKYGNDVQFSTVMHRAGIEPRFELRCFTIY